jgi:hypothetical protein
MKKDPLTGEEFEPRRSNQRFARPENRIKYHNDKSKQKRKKREFISKPLRKNEKILDYWMKGKEKATFHYEFLKGAGYDFNVFSGTSIVENKTGYCLFYYILTFEKPNVHVIRNY